MFDGFLILKMEFQKENFGAKSFIIYHIQFEHIQNLNCITVVINDIYDKKIYSYISKIKKNSKSGSEYKHKTLKMITL